MSNYFPRQTVAWKLEEPPAFRRLTLSLVEMALLTGVVLRLYRSLVLTHGSDSPLYFGVTIVVGLLFVFGMVSMHLGNYPVRHWLWRAPAFAALEFAGEMATSLVLIALHREPLGTSRAEWHDWPALAQGVLYTRVVAIVLFTLVLAAVVQTVRYFLLRVEHKDHMLEVVEHAQERKQGA